MRNRDGCTSEWIIVPEKAIKDDRKIDEYWIVDLSNGINIRPETCERMEILRFYEFEETFESLIKYMKNAFDDELEKMILINDIEKELKE